LNLEIEEDEMDLVASLYDEKSGRFMEVYTDLPGMQLYTGNFMRKETGKDGAQYDRRYGVCFETQFFPNACNTPAFESSIFDAEVPFDYCTVYAFSVK
jgi:aldose 1-epimerase